MTTFTAAVEFSIDGAWVDVTRLDDSTYVMGPISITRGRARQGERMAPMQISFRMRDDDCVIDGENPASPYFRKIVQGTQVRVAVDGNLRGVGEIATIDQIPGETTRANFVDIVAAGALRRLDIPQRPLNSAAYDAFSSPENDTTRVFYAPLEEESGATKIAVFGGRGSVADDQPVTLGGDSDSKSSARLVTFGADGKLEAEIPFYTSTQHKICMLWKFPEGGLANGNVPVRLHCTGGNIDRIHLRYNTPWTLILDAMRGFSIADSAVNVDWTGYIDQNQEWFLSIELTQNGADVDCLVGIIREDGVFGIPTDTLTGVTIGRIYHITIGANDIDGSAFGHLVLGNDTGAFSNYISHVSNTANGVNGYTTEFADTRMLRLLNAAGVDFGVRQATLGDAVEMGPQRPGQLGDLIYDCVDADDGILAEHRLFFALEYATRFALYNQPPAARLIWKHLSAPFKPVLNDVDLFNDFQVSRPGGTAERYAIPDGDYQHWTTEQPPNGIGPRPGEQELNLWPDDEVGNHAAWRAHLFSWREKRFDQVTVELARSAFTSGDRADVRSLDPGDLLVIDTTGAPPYVPYTELRLLIQGYIETITKHTHTITFNTTPADIYEVEQVDADGSTLVAPITSSSTSVKLSPPAKGPAWTEDFGDLPYHIQVAGQPMTVTVISTDTPAYIAASAAVASANNGPVAPALPAGITADAGQLLLVWATIRNSGTGTVNTPTGWTKVVDYGNTAWLGRYYIGGDTAPSVTFTGGVANADCLARMFAFSGLSMVLGSGTKGTPAAHTQLNGAAQNIAYPPITLPRDGAVILAAWKQDDWTGVTPPSGFTEVSDDPTTTGDDAAIWVGYDLTGVAAVAGTLVVAGGAVAISRAVVMGLRPLQTATVTRGIASTATAATVGSEVHGWRMGVNGL